MTTQQKNIEFTPEEAERLAKAIRTAAVGILSVWEALLQVAHRIGRDWEPTHTSVRDIAEDFAAALDNPDDVDSIITHEEVAKRFGNPADWIDEPKATTDY